MLPPIPFFDVSGYKRRSSSLTPEDIDLATTRFPGFVEHRIAGGSSRIGARLAKRYATPLGKSPPQLLAFGTLPPVVTLTGRPTLGSLEMAVQVTTPGIVGAAVFRWSQDGGETWTSTSTAATVALGTTGLTANFPAGSYGADNVYRASTPIPEIVLGWLVAIVDVDVWRRRGVNPQDPMIELAVADRTAALAEIEEAANAKEGLYDLPTNDMSGDSTITRSGPLCYTESSPFVGADLIDRAGVCEDENGTGTYGGNWNG
jgi:hypothetical protein